MKWRCEWCGKPHEENDPPCDNCGHGTFEKAVQPIGPERTDEESTPGGSVWVCQDCGRQHQRNSPPCRRCGGANFEREAVADTDPLDEIGTSWRDVVEPKYVVGYAVVAVLVGVLVLGFLGIVPLPGFGGGAAEGPPPAVPAAPGAADSVEGLDITAVEGAYLDTLNDRRTGAGAAELTRSSAVDEAAAYYNKATVAARYGDGEPPSREAFDRFPLACERPTVVGYQVAYDRTGTPLSGFEDETALGSALADSYVERGAPFRSAERGTFGVDIHVAPDGRVFVTHVLC
ncbi:hypothetical protein ACFQL1_16775 [Halomicroarcula sp. GCM10025709]|uniref:hypothetical protein n=1 Tax=Haloarcula TaxID=2237 RepID=UPI0024C2BA82|nr:hypothetical protein [Halomicroarcula sp. YJ-61-S]